MRRPIRWAFNFSAVVSAVLFVAACALWARSYSVSDGFEYSGVVPDTYRCDQYTLQLTRGLARFVHTRHTFGTPAGLQLFQSMKREWGFAHSYDPPGELPPGHGSLWGWLGFSSHRDQTVRMMLIGPPSRQLGLLTIEGGEATCPLWSIALLVSIPAVVRLSLFVRPRRRRFTGRCRVCGYDLRASPEPGGALLGRCPECGTPSRAGKARRHPMAPLPRRSFSGLCQGLCLLSLLASLAAVWLWWRSGRTADDVFLPTGGPRRYSVRSEAGHMTLFEPPPPGRVAAARSADWRALFHGHHLECIAWQPIGKRVHLFSVGPCPNASQTQDVSAGLKDATAADVSGPMLDGLDSDAAFGVAHWALTEKVDRPALGYNYPPRWPAGWQGPRPEPLDSTVFNGLVLRFPPGQPHPKPERDKMGHYNTYRVTVDPEQRPAIRAYWHRRLRVPVLSIAYGWLACATALPPLVSAGVRLRRTCVRRRRRRLGLCLACGYDLAGNTGGRCGECGKAIEANGRVTGMRWLRVPPGRG